VHHVRISLTAQSAAWNGPMRGWLEHRARELRDEGVVHGVRIVEDGVAGEGAACLSWELRLDISDHDGAEPVVAELLADLRVLRASPRLIVVKPEGRPPSRDPGMVGAEGPQPGLPLGDRRSPSF
jgi:hypothetical protein